MTITGRFLDQTTGEPIEGVSVQVVDRYYVNTNTGTVTNSEGVFRLDSNLFDTGYYLLYITDVSYEPVVADPLVFSRTTDYALQRQFDVLAPPVITPANNQKKEMSIGGWLLFGVLAYMGYKAVK